MMFRSVKSALGLVAASMATILVFCITGSGAMRQNPDKQLRVRGMVARYNDASPILDPGISMLTAFRNPNAAASLRFFGQVGGVAFGATASSSRYTISDISYDGRRANGSRVQAVLRDRTTGARISVAVPMGDWLLAPTAQIANSKNDSLVTVMSDASHPSLFTPIRYHRALLNTYLGMYLFLGDVTLLYEGACDLPYIGTPRLSAQVLASRQQKWESAHKAILALFRTPDATNEYMNQYIITEQNGVTYDVQGGRLILSGETYWRAVHSYRDSSGSVSRVAYLSDMSRKLTQLERSSTEVNPQVYEALRQTMRYAAFFRAAKAGNPLAYWKFVGALPNAATFVTPTSYVEL